MTSHLVAGVPLPDHVGGHLALELCNTRALWDRPDEREYFVSSRAMLLWAREHRVVTATEARQLGAASSDAQRAALGRLKALRTAVFRAVTEGRLDQVHPFVARAVDRAAYAPSGELRVPYGNMVVVDRCALAAHDLLTRHGPAAVHLCASDACGWVFLDPTGRRRWCSMAVCGNRAKARRHAARQRAAG